MKRFSVISLLVFVVLSIAIAGCGSSGTTSNPITSPSPSPTPSSSPGLTDTEQINALLDLTEKAFCKQADINACFTTSVDCGKYGTKTPQEILNTFGCEGDPAAFSSFLIKDRVIPDTGDNRTVGFYVLYCWSGTDTSVDTDPCNIVVVKTSNGWRISTFGDVLDWFLKPRGSQNSTMLRKIIR